MKVRMGRRDDYAVRAVLHLARHEREGLCKKREIAEQMGIPEAFLPQILAELVTAGIVRSRLGRGGGYELARPAAEVSLLDVVTAVEDEIGVDACVLRGGPCGRPGDQCAVHRFWLDAEQSFRARLAASTFADIAAEDTLLTVLDSGPAVERPGESSTGAAVVTATSIDPTAAVTAPEAAPTAPEAAAPAAP